MVDMRPETYGKKTKDKINEMISYRFSHAGLSDLYDHVMLLLKRIQGDSYKEGGDAETSPSSFDKVVHKDMVGYVRIETFEADIANKNV